MTRMFFLRPLALLTCVLVFSMTPAQAQESAAAPAPESFLKIINEQIAAMSNTTFDLVVYNGPPIPNGSIAPGDVILDENGNVLAGGSSAAAGMTPNSKFKVHFSNISEHWVTRIYSNGHPNFDHITYPGKGNSRVIHSRKEFVTDVKNSTAFALAYSLLPLSFVEKYRSISSSAPPSSVVWAVESHSPEQTTLVLRAGGKVRMRTTFAIPSHMCTSLRTYDENEQELDFIEAVPGRTITNLPFLATSYKKILKGKFTTLCETVSTAPLAPGALKPYVKPRDYLQLTEEDMLRRAQSTIKKSGP